jgi:hypothetical protein
MIRGIHALFIGILVVTGVAVTLGAAMYGADYYLTPLKERPFHPQYDTLKPTGYLGHGYGIVGSLMVLLGVTIYSSRKRIRRFSAVGKLKHFLEFHIFLCLTGPILVVYHTTFKLGGLVAVSFWSMVAVVASGLIGRYLYAQIPRGIQGQEVDLSQLVSWHKQLADNLQNEFGLDPQMISRIDAIGATSKPPAEMSLLEVLRSIVTGDLTRSARLRALARDLHARGVRRDLTRRIVAAARTRVVLARRIAMLERLRVVFHHWHVVHLPFSIVMFAILFIHVGVAIAFGYRWIF